MSIFDKAVSFINRETIQENESKKMSVVIRMLSLFIVCFLIILLIFCLCSRVKYGLPSVALSIIVYGIVFHMTYHVGKRYSVTAFIITTIIWSILNLWLFGWFCGVQTMVIQLVLICYFASYGALLKKAIFSSFIFVVYMGLYCMFAHATPVNEFTAGHMTFLRVFFIMLVIVNMSALAYVFSNESQDMESKLVEYNKKLEKKSSTDPLTGLYNRGKAMEILCDLEKQTGTDTFSLCICDIDFFKKVNDNYGHDVGDKVLIEVSNILSKIVKGYGYVARWGGEEFMIIFPKTNGDDASTVIYAIQSEIKKMAVKNGDDEIKVTLTYGLTEFSPNQPLDQSIKDADNKLYRGKEEGRNMLVY